MNPTQHDADLGFSFRASKSGEVTILRNGSAVTQLRGDVARRFILKVSNASFGEQQQAMARITGNYKRGNERAGLVRARRSE